MGKPTPEQRKKFQDHGCALSAHWCECTLYDGSRCSRGARYNIDGINLCTQHAGPIAIIKLIKTGEAKELEIFNPYLKNPLCNLTSIFDQYPNRKIKS